MRVSNFTGADATWDAFVRSAPGWTHFHLIGWKNVIERVFGHECIYLAAHDDALALVGVLPLVRVKSMVFGHFLVSMPFLNYGGPLGTDAAVRALADHASQLAERDGARLMELRSRTPLPVDLPVSHRKVTVLLDLPRDAETLWKSLYAKVRSQVRRPRKEGVTVRFGPDQVGPFFEVFARPTSRSSPAANGPSTFSWKRVTSTTPVSSPSGDPATATRRRPPSRTSSIGRPARSASFPWRPRGGAGCESPRPAAPTCATSPTE
jgi:hypothetical protein